jgi:energy-coupling factor transport system ATP-binding protein
LLESNKDLQKLFENDQLRIRVDGELIDDFTFGELEKLAPLKTFNAVYRPNNRQPRNRQYQGIELRELLEALEIDLEDRERVVFSAADGLQRSYSLADVLIENNVFIAVTYDGRVFRRGISATTPYPQEDGGPFVVIRASDPFSQFRVRILVEIIMNVLEVKNLTLGYGDRILFEDLSFELKEGQILGIAGSNGTGKSTLCKRIAAIRQGELSSTGQVLLYGTEVLSLSAAERCKHMAVIFQEPETQLFSPFVCDELAFACENLLVERQQIKKRIDFVTKLCGIEHLTDKRTNNLSGGEKQLIAIAAALTVYPRLIIADEITARLDTDARQRIRKVLVDFADSGGAVIFVHHAKDDAEICHSIIEVKSED